ncbi:MULTISPECIES: manganese-dependent transcriptional regulator PerR [Meiothermus]|jgi:Fe2+ or Zn2+ uptake regulation protein|uniref:Transcriptional regulator FurA n=3 Tax=Meiothermus TaxID=65551 RepID=A0A399DXD2_9DEIN|nr:MULTISPECIES: transcriptional repressor [Meiothermus]GIW31243.1 MAG: transcriptional repressor [Meiothermus sp.]AWR85707.1 ferric uptake regulator, Fur family [Meiothermus taiwanensis WR-220]KIQ55529.1 Fur family transcriptional regulator [Meiothermus taiwanensis]KZK15924.1 transcriptional repressor [Meiothermus taiwanensis]MCL6530652.1 transcriptional repressor [Meiothermus ruber]
MRMKRLTKQRKAVLEVVRSAKGHHPDAAWVYAEVRKQVPSISLGTVYRTLDALTEEGYLVPLARPGEALRYEANLDGHLHMVCRKCNRFFDIVHPLPDLLSEVKAKYPAFVIEDVQVEYQGLCPACQAATAK